jgi:hypothetical protein
VSSRSRSQRPPLQPRLAQQLLVPLPVARETLLLPPPMVLRLSTLLPLAPLLLLLLGLLVHQGRRIQTGRAQTVLLRAVAAAPVPPVMLSCPLPPAVPLMRPAMDLLPRCLLVLLSAAVVVPRAPSSRDPRLRMLRLPQRVASYAHAAHWPPGRCAGV